MTEPQDIPELMDEDRAQSDSLRPFGAAHLSHPPARLRKQGSDPTVMLAVVMALAAGFGMGLLVGLLLPW